MGLELPEIICLSGEMEETLKGKVITKITLGDRSKSLIKQGMCNLDRRSEEIFKTPLKSIEPCGKWIFVEFDNGKFLLLGEIIGRFSYHRASDPVPPKYHVLFQFQDGTFLTFQSLLYAFLEVADKWELEAHKYAGNQGVTPISDEFTYTYFSDVLSRYENRGIKGVLNLQSEISGLGNAYINDILYQAQIHPKTKISSLDDDKKMKLYQSITETINHAMEEGGSSSEYDLHSKKGNYLRLMDRKSEDMKCSRCGTKIIKMNVLGSSSYLCPECQKM
jgi:formamidopyrimidine-DNA glycosylase